MFAGVQLPGPGTFKQDVGAEYGVPAVMTMLSGATPAAQKPGFACIAAARLEASMAASEREPATLVLESPRASILARPRSPMVETTRATITSMRLKPRARR